MLKKLRLFVAVALALFGFAQAAYAIPGGCPVEGSEPMTIGPVNPANGFPLWVQDSTGLTVEVCLDPLLCIFDPVDPGNPFSVQIGFGAEGFMASAETDINALSFPGVTVDALLVTAVELAFLTETPADGDQFPFTRLRIRVDVAEAGIYTVTHPWGQEVITVPAVITGQEIRESFDIEFAADTTHQGRIGPILRWDADLPVLDADLEAYIGDPAIPHAVTGSPCGTNFFRIQAVALDGSTPLIIDPLDSDGDTDLSSVTQTLFVVTGKVFTGISPAPLTVNRASYTRQADSSGQVDVFALSAPTASVAFNGNPNLPAGPITLTGDGNGLFSAALSLPDASVLPLTIAVVASNPGNDPTTQIVSLRDRVNITRAEYDVLLQTLTVEAASSDALANPVLTAFGFGNLISGALTVSNVAAAPATVTVTSAAGGSDTEDVTVIAPSPVAVLIAHYYTTILGRTASNAEIAAWEAEITRLLSLGIDPREGFVTLAKLFFGSAEYVQQGTLDAEYVTDLYTALLMRTPSAAEVDAWVALIGAGMTRGVVLNYFIFSPEFGQVTLPTVVSASRPENNLINDFYRGLLQRLPDTVGFNLWLPLMRAAQCTGAQAVRDLSSQIAEAFVQSGEYGLLGRNDTEYLEDLYDAFLRRGAFQDEFTFWLAQLAGGMTRLQVLQNFVNSPEFQLRLDEVIAAGCLP